MKDSPAQTRSTPVITPGTVLDVFAGELCGADLYGTRTCVQVGEHEGIRWALFHDDSPCSANFVVISGRELAQLESYVRDSETPALSR